MHKISRLVLIASTFLAFSAQARNLTTEEKLSDLNQLVSLMKHGYGPLRYKAATRGIRLDEVAAQFAERIEATETNGDFYYTLVQFVAAFKDSHFGARLPTTHAATLPFSTDLVEGKVLIDAVNRRALPESVFPFRKGDEVVSFGGRPVAEVVAELATYQSAGYELTAQRRGAQSLTSRAATVVPVQTGDVLIELKAFGEEAVTPVVLTWALQGEAVDEFAGDDLDLARPIGVGRRNFDALSLPADDIAPQPGIERGFRCAGITREAIPNNATIIMMTPFVAYYHPTEKGNVGYLRIPEYMAANPETGKSEFELRFSQYEYAVSVLEKNTVGLIIDQDHNCGGSVDWLHRIAGLFMPAAFQPQQFQLLANKQEYLEFQQWVDEQDSHTLAYGDLLKTLGLIRETWKQGDFLTPKTSIDGAALIPVHHTRYSKPIVMLIDELSGSGGDAFPALLQGHGRAKLLGTRTMGAGGHVVEEPSPFYSRLTVRMTKSLFYRPDGVAVENNGAVPDYAYSPTREDFTHEYRGYQAFYLSKLFEQLH